MGHWSPRICESLVHVGCESENYYWLAIDLVLVSRSPLGTAQLGAALEDGVTGKPQEALKHEITNK